MTGRHRLYDPWGQECIFFMQIMVFLMNEFINKWMGKQISEIPTWAKGQTIILRNLKEPDPTTLQRADIKLSEKKLQYMKVTSVDPLS